MAVCHACGVYHVCCADRLHLLVHPGCLGRQVRGTRGGRHAFMTCVGGRRRGSSHRAAHGPDLLSPCPYPAQYAFKMDGLLVSSHWPGEEGLPRSLCICMRADRMACPQAQAPHPPRLFGLLRVHLAAPQWALKERDVPPKLRNQIIDYVQARGDGMWAACCRCCWVELAHQSRALRGARPSC